MQTIYKYPLQITDRQTLQIPHSFKVLHVGNDPGHNLCLWAQVSTENDVVPVEFAVVGTGHELSSTVRTKHLGSVVQGPFVWHIFQIQGLAFVVCERDTMEDMIHKAALDAAFGDHGQG